MPNKTANYNLIKPLGSEHYDINVHNGNMDIIDEELKRVTESNNKRIEEETRKVTESTNKRIDDEVKKTEELIKNIKVPVTSVNSKVGDLILSANDIKNSEGKTIETKLNELFQSANSSLQSANSGKAAIAGAVGGVTGQNSFDEIANYIVAKRNEIGSNLGAGDYATMQRLNDWTVQRKIDLVNQLSAKGVSSNNSENLGSLISKVGTIQTGLRFQKGAFNINIPNTIYGGNDAYTHTQKFDNLSFKPNLIMINSFKGINFTANGTSLGVALNYFQLFNSDNEHAAMSVRTPSGGNVYIGCYIYFDPSIEITNNSVQIRLKFYGGGSISGGAYIDAQTINCNYILVG